MDAGVSRQRVEGSMGVCNLVEKILWPRSYELLDPKEGDLGCIATDPLPPPMRRSKGGRGRRIGSVARGRCQLNHWERGQMRGGILDIGRRVM